MKAGSFAVFASAILLAGASLAAAQQQVPPLPVPPQQSPAALSVPDPFAGFRPGPRDLYRSPDGSDRFQHISPHPATPPHFFFPGVVLPGLYFPSPYYMHAPAESAPTARPVGVPRGGLMIEAVPSFAQVFVDGFYMGLAEEFGLRGRALDLTFGTHRIELKAAGYETLSFNVVIEANRILRYRGDMQLLSTKPVVVIVQSPPAAPRSFYVIPNCYAGDKPPTGTLPKGCDVKNLQTRK